MAPIFEPRPYSGVLPDPIGLALTVTKQDRLRSTFPGSSLIVRFAKWAVAAPPTFPVLWMFRDHITPSHPREGIKIQSRTFYKLRVFIPYTNQGKLYSYECTSWSGEALNSFRAFLRKRCSSFLTRERVIWAILMLICFLFSIYASNLASRAPNKPGEDYNLPSSFSYVLRLFNHPSSRNLCPITNFELIIRPLKMASRVETIFYIY